MLNAIIDQFLAQPSEKLLKIEFYSFSYDGLFGCKEDQNISSDKLRKFFSALKTCVKLKSISLSYNFLGAMEESSFIPFLKILFATLSKQLESICISDSPRNGVDAKNWLNLCRFISACEKLRKFSLQGFYIETLRVEDWSNLGAALSKLTMLTDFSIHGDLDSEAYPLNAWGQFVVTVGACKALERLSITGCNLNKLPAKHWLLLGKNLATSKNLRDICLRGNCFEDLTVVQKVAGLATALSHVKNLQRIDLSKNWVSEFDEEAEEWIPKDWSSLPTLLKAIFISNLNLNRLSLANNDLINLNDETYSEFCAALSTAHKLKELDLSDCFIGDLDILRWGELCNALSKLNNLEKIIMRAGNLRVEQWQRLAIAFADLNKLNTIILAEHYSGLDENIDQIDFQAKPREWQACFAALTHIRNLQYLDVTTNTLSQLNDEEWNKCLGSILQFNNLRYFYISKNASLQPERLAQLYTMPNSPLIFNGQIAHGVEMQDFLSITNRNKFVVSSWYASIIAIFMSYGLHTTSGPISKILEYLGPSNAQLDIFMRLLKKKQSEFVAFTAFADEIRAMNQINKKRPGYTPLRVYDFARDANQNIVRFAPVFFDAPKGISRKRTSSFIEDSDSEGYISRKSSRQRMSVSHELSEEEASDWEQLRNYLPISLSPVSVLGKQLDNIHTTPLRPIAVDADPSSAFSTPTRPTRPAAPSANGRISPKRTYC